MPDPRTSPIGILYVTSFTTFRGSSIIYCHRWRIKFATRAALHVPWMHRWNVNTFLQFICRFQKLSFVWVVEETWSIILVISINAAHTNLPSRSAQNHRLCTDLDGNTGTMPMGANDFLWYVTGDVFPLVHAATPWQCVSNYPAR